MKYLFTLISLFLVNFVSAQDFYDLTEIQTIEITFEENNWDQLLDNAYSSTGDYILAQSVAINGVVFDSVGVKYKGNSTYSPNQAKNPFHIELDTYKDQEYQNYTDIKLSNVAKDPSFLREVLSYTVIRNYMDTPLSNYANVFVNGSLIGLYSNSESISKKFVNKRFDSKSNTFVKCNPPAGAGPQSNDFPNLVYMGEDSTNYYDAYELKSDFGWDELIDLCDTLSNQTDAIEEILDVDRALWMLALDNVMVNLDSYIGGFAQNYYLYRDDNGRFIPIIWDLNESFGRFTMSGAGNLNSTNAKRQMDHLLHDNDSDFPLIQKLLGNPTYKRMYLAHYKTILLEQFENGSYAETGQIYQDLIAESVQNDDNKFFTYNNFLDNLDSDVGGGGGGPGGGSTIGIRNLMDGRTSYLLGLSDFTQVEPTIDNIEFSTDSPLINESLTVTATIENANQAFLGTRTGRNDVFQKVEMFDDGIHNDGAANDGIYGVDVVVQQALTQFFIYAENVDAGKFSPQRAEYEYHELVASITSIEASDLVINEFMASNDETEADQDNEFDDWIELYNNSNDAIDLEGYFLSDNPENFMKWTFPEGASIGAGEYLIIWADEDGEQEGLHCSFKLSASGESIFLADPAGELIDEVSYGTQETDISYGRFPNGTGDFQTMNATFNAENDGTVSVLDNEFVTFDITLYPNPTFDELSIETEERLSDIRIYNTSGQLVMALGNIDSTTKIVIQDLQEGMYFVKVMTSDARYVVRSFVKSSY